MNDHPLDTELVDYAESDDGLSLPSMRREKIAAHLQVCNLCRGKLLRLADDD